MLRTDILEKKEEILQWIEEKQSKAFIARELHCDSKTLNRYLEQMDIQYNGNQGSKGKTRTVKRGWNLEEYLANSKSIQTNKIRKKILEEGIKEHRCENCGLTTWLDKPIPLEVHHKDGNKHNNVLENFQLLCPNCHAFTDSYRGKNIQR